MNHKPMKSWYTPRNDNSNDAKVHNNVIKKKMKIAMSKKKINLDLICLTHIQYSNFLFSHRMRHNVVYTTEFNTGFWRFEMGFYLLLFFFYFDYHNNLYKVPENSFISLNWKTAMTKNAILILYRYMWSWCIVYSRM